MANVAGLRPTQSGPTSGNAQQKKGRPQVNSQGAGRSVGLRPAGGMIQTNPSRPAGEKVGQTAKSLADSLASLSPSLMKYGQNMQDNIDADAMRNLSTIENDIRKEVGDGTITQTQVGELYPELSKTVASRISESMGANAADEWVKGRIQEVMENSDIRLNSDNRGAWAEGVRQRAMEESGEADFYGAGFVGHVNNMLDRYESRWMDETASFHKAEQMSHFKRQAGLSLIDGNADAMLELDDEMDISSSLTRRERKDALVDEAVNQAMLNRDPDILDRVPERFLNSELKTQIEQARGRLDQVMHSEYTKRTDALLNETLVDVINSSFEGHVDPRDYRDVINNPDIGPEVFAFIETTNNREFADGVLSHSNRQQFQQGVLVGAVSGEYGDNFFMGDNGNFEDAFPNGNITVEGLTQHIATRRDMSRADKKALIDQVPQLMEGMDLLQDPAVLNKMSVVINKGFSQLGGSLNADISGMFGHNLQAESAQYFQSEVTSRFLSHLEQNGQWPRGADKRDILDATTADVLDLMNRASKPENMSSILNEGLSGVMNDSERPPTQPDQVVEYGGNSVSFPPEASLEQIRDYLISSGTPPEEAEALVGTLQR